MFIIILQNGIFSNNTEYVSPTLELNYQATQKIGVSGSGGFALAGRNILASPNWSMGVYFKLRLLGKNYVMKRKKVLHKWGTFFESKILMGFYNFASS
ncbi:MAG: hypothetical protein JJE09_01210 [Bacteroidia bacterium]|nr:hypothetical protein [Bacteroidia bacterium]